VFWGVLLTAVGVVLLLQRLGFWPASALRQIVWPLVLIGLGAWVLWAAMTRREPTTEGVTIPREGVERARVAIKHSAGRLRVGAGAAPDALLSGTFAGGVRQRVVRDGSTAEIELRVAAGAEPWTAWTTAGGRSGGMLWDVALSPEVALELSIDSGASETTLDLSELEVTDLRVATGVGAAHIRLPAHAGRMRARINTGVGAATIRVPDGVAARIRAESGLGDVHVNRERFPRSGGVYESTDYAIATDAIELELRTGLGEVRVE